MDKKILLVLSILFAIIAILFLVLVIVLPSEKVDDAKEGIVAFMRRGKTAKDQLLFICNFVPVERNNYMIGAPCLTKYEEILNSDDEKFGGHGNVNGTVTALPQPCDRMKNSICVNVPPLSVMVFKYNYTDK